MAEARRAAVAPVGEPLPDLTLLSSEHQLPDGRYLIAYRARWDGPRRRSGPRTRGKEPRAAVAAPPDA